MSTDGKDGAAATGRSSVQMGAGSEDGGETVVGGEGLTSKTRILMSAEHWLLVRAPLPGVIFPSTAPRIADITAALADAGWSHRWRHSAVALALGPR